MNSRDPRRQLTQPNRAQRGGTGDVVVDVIDLEGSFVEAGVNAIAFKEAVGFASNYLRSPQRSGPDR
jgi:hypothetical protein